MAGPVLHSACLGIAGSVAVLIGFLASNHAGDRLALLILTSFVMAFLAASLCLQALDSSVTAIYVCFAEHPAALRAHFPLVYYRLARITEFSATEFAAELPSGPASSGPQSGGYGPVARS